MSATQEIVLDPPLRGEWAILNPPGHPRLAFDFLATKGTRLPYAGTAVIPHFFGSIAVGTTYAWRQPVFAPLDGVVVACSDGAPDRERISMVRDLLVLLTRPPRPGSPFEAYGGNYVILQSSHCYPLLAHLRCGSVCVKTGDHVRAGERLGEVGNSGSSIQPHLHFQVMSSRDPFPLFENLLPFKFRNIRKRVGREWKEFAVAGLENRDHLQL